MSYFPFWLYPKSFSLSQAEKEYVMSQAASRLSDELEPQQDSQEPGFKGFQVSLDVEHFRVEEMSVRLQRNLVIVEARHEERPDQHGFVSRHFIRKYVLPPEVDPDQLTSTLSSDGVLTIRAPRRQPGEGDSRTIEMQLVGPVRDAGSQGRIK